MDLGAAASGVRYLVLLQLLTRVLTFAINQFLVRRVGPQIIGLATVRFELLLSTILFLSREGFRLALLRGNSDIAEKKESVQGEQTQENREDKKGDAITRVINIAWIIPPIGALLALSSCFGFLYFDVEMTSDSSGKQDVPTTSRYQYVASVWIYGFAALLELLSEPVYILAASQFRFGLRAATEGAAVFTRCMVTFVLLSIDPSLGVQAFAWAQVAQSLVTCLGFYGFFVRQLCWSDHGLDGVRGWRNLFPAKRAVIAAPSSSSAYFGIIPVSWMGSYLDGHLLNLAFTFSKQSVLKHLLTEGDKLILSLFSNLYDQGVYAVVVNYGSLVARILLLPVEETTRAIFVKLFASKTAVEPSSSPSKPPSDVFTQARKMLLILLKFEILLGMLFCCFGSNYAGLLIDLLLGSRWSRETDAPAVLSLYCVYILAIALNGITEAFLVSAADSAALSAMNQWMVLFSGLYMVECAFLISWMGTKGLIFANILNMTVRIAYSTSFAADLFHFRASSSISFSSTWPQRAARALQLLLDAVPHVWVVCSFVSSFAITAIAVSSIGFETITTKLQLVALGGLCLLFCFGVTYVHEKKFLHDLRQLFFKSRTE